MKSLLSVILMLLSVLFISGTTSVAAEDKPNTVTIAKVLRQAGYTTGIVGKWGLGAPHSQSTPIKMGFDFFVGYNCQRDCKMNSV